MSMEFLMPQKYDGENCGISVAVCGLNESVGYKEIVIYIEGLEQDKCYVEISDNKFKTTKATFDNLKKNIYYNVIAEISFDNGTQKIQTKIPALTIFNSETKDSCQETFNNTNKENFKNGLIETKCEFKILF